jgi:hypothetical protein
VTERDPSVALAKAWAVEIRSGRGDWIDRAMALEPDMTPERRERITASLLAMADQADAEPTGPKP